ncbi:glycoside hydrolase family 76 protein [Lophiostoma macrostomum CBS 122681]|uniref:mannan endo-1,6-alpha-mannosidase n=1 Tax=Lophiostoma macrostomum CBS 122681 TaxID=1314788 RepID=A0A6A6TF98_9PLEO|nr:glycoside hydrolase family 76 protein [Lophiostoma macrostomum CBS 122681]
MRFSSSLGAVLLPFVVLVGGIDFNPDDEASIKTVTRQYAYGLMSYYVNNATGTAPQDIGVFPKPPHYWWEAGAAWGGMVEYTQLTGDTSHEQTLQQALVANYGPNNDILLPWRKDQEGNDDQAFWALTIMSALEYQFPEPGSSAPATYLQVAENAFNNIVGRWDTTSCNGGLKWQIYPENDYGYDYKNSISNGATFALAARLARYTGNQTYVDWAIKIWDWQKAVGLMSDKYEVFDGSNDKKNCSDFDHTEWSYNVGVYLHGAAVMYNYTKGDETWKKHTSGLLEHIATTFFKPYDNATDIMFEKTCETFGKCNIDQLSFKAYLARFLSKTAIMAPFTKEQVTTWLRTSAIGAAKSCAGKDESACGSKWYLGGWDGTSGVGQQLSALEVTQALLTLQKDVVPGTGGNNTSPSSSTIPGASSTSSVVVGSSTGIPSTQLATQTSSTVTSTNMTAVITSATPSSIPASSNSVSAASTGAGGNLDQEPVAGPTSTSCTRTSNTTIYVPPSSSSKCSTSSTTTIYVPPTIPAVSTHSANATISVPPPASTTGPEQFPGTATNNRVATLTIVVAALIVAISLMS